MPTPDWRAIYNPKYTADQIVYGWMLRVFFWVEDVLRHGLGGKLRGHFFWWDGLNCDPLFGGDVVGVKTFAGVVQARQQAPEKPTFHCIAGLRPALLEVSREEESWIKVLYSRLSVGCLSKVYLNK